jgi:hypothetical protein
MVDIRGVVSEVEEKGKNHKRFFRFLEFFIIGFLFGVGEDLMVVVLATDEGITRHTLIVAALVALPFAVLSELIVDKPEVRLFLRERYFSIVRGGNRMLRRK